MSEALMDPSFRWGDDRASFGPPIPSLERTGAVYEGGSVTLNLVSP
jgi:hypothetical protein